MINRALTASHDKLEYVLRIDGKIKHLEAVLRARGGKELIFARDHWKQRIEQARSTPGLLPAQKKRLDKLLKRLEMPAQRRLGRPSAFMNPGLAGTSPWRYRSRFNAVALKASSFAFSF